MTHETIIVEKSDDGVATITLNRPDQINTFTPTMLREVRAFWGQVKEDPGIRAIVLRAAGDRGFCAGIDPDGGFRTADDRLRPFENATPGAWLGAKQNKVWVPLVCAVQGVCAGGAFYFLNEADIVICSEDARFFDPHVSFGTVAAVEPVGLLARLPLAEVQRMALMGSDERITAATALRISLVTEVTPRERLWPRAHEIAAVLANKHPVAMQGSVRAIWESLSLPHAEAISNALNYALMGNPIVRADTDFKPAPPAKARYR